MVEGVAVEALVDGVSGAGNRFAAVLANDVAAAEMA